MRFPRVLLASLVLAAACKAKADAPAADPPAVRSSLRGDSSSVAKPADADGVHALLAVYWMEHGETSVELLGMLTPSGGFGPPPLGDEASWERFYHRWLNRGHEYRVLRGGRPTGTVTITENDFEGCVGLTAVTESMVSEPGFYGAGLATDAPVGGAAVLGRPSGAELAEMTALLRETMGAWRPDAEVRVLRLALRDGQAAWVGSAALRDHRPESHGWPRHASFVIAERASDGRMRPVTSWHTALSDEDESQELEQKLLDAADLDGDGTPEIVSHTSWTDGARYTIYARRSDGWTQVYATSSHPC